MSDLQDIADRFEIEALHGEFNDAVMMRDYDRLASLFTEDGVVRIPHINAEAVSWEEIRAGVERLQIGRRPTVDLVKGPETRTVEFKETARWDVRRGVRDAKMEHEVLKTVAGFLNSAGGTLLVGVRNEGQVVGIGPDLSTFGTTKNPEDSFTNWLSTLFTQAFGAADAALPRIRLESVDATLRVCRIDVPASSHPVFVASDEDAFFVRLDNSTRRLTPRETMDYVRERWPSV